MAFAPESTRTELLIVRAHTKYLIFDIECIKLKKHAWNAISHSGHTSSRDTSFVQWAVNPSRKRSEAFRLVSMNGDHASNNLV